MEISSDFSNALAIDAVNIAVAAEELERVAYIIGGNSLIANTRMRVVEYEARGFNVLKAIQKVYKELWTSDI